MIILAQDWQNIRNKSTLQSLISTITGLPSRFLLGWDIGEASVAQRIPWASERQTTRIEDLAYCLLGIFRIHMPLWYGERTHAFLRLQEELIGVTDDHSIFAWISDKLDRGIKLYGLLAQPPDQFKHPGSVMRSTTCLRRSQLEVIRYPVTNKGIYICLPLKRVGAGKDYHAALICATANPSRQWVAIRLRDVSQHGGRFLRSNPQDLLFLIDSIFRSMPVQMVNFKTRRSNRVNMALWSTLRHCGNEYLCIRLMVLTLSAAFLLFLHLFGPKPFQDFYLQ